MVYSEERTTLRHPGRRYEDARTCLAALMWLVELSQATDLQKLHQQRRRIGTKVEAVRCYVLTRATDGVR